ncbi:MAG: hypothetical protein J6J65_05565 [Opitutales bacterium]|nr:hypothetical protein [Opitutales bacterium]
MPKCTCGDWPINVDRNCSPDYLVLRISDGWGNPGKMNMQIDGNVISKGTPIFATDNVSFTVNGAVDISGGSGICWQTTRSRKPSPARWRNRKRRRQRRRRKRQI